MFKLEWLVELSGFNIGSDTTTQVVSHSLQQYFWTNKTPFFASHYSKELYL